jgi:hypothetical protein
LTLCDLRFSPKKEIFLLPGLRPGKISLGCAQGDCRTDSIPDSVGRIQKATRQGLKLGDIAGQVKPALPQRM